MSPPFAGPEDTRLEAGESHVCSENLCKGRTWSRELGYLGVREGKSTNNATEQIM